MAKQEIRLIIGVDGTVTIEPTGFTGPACEAATKAIEEALGEVVDRKKKPEYYQTQQKQSGTIGAR